MTSRLDPRRRWRSTCAAVGTAFAMTSCGLSAPPQRTVAEVAEGYVRAALQLAQHDPGLVDDWRGSDAWRPGPREPVAPILARIQTLRRDLGGREFPSTREADRAAYLTGQLAALELAARRLLGESSGFDDEARRGFGVSLPHADAGQLQAAREALSLQLPGQAPLRERLAAFKKRFVVPPDRADAVMRAALTECRSVTVGALPLPPDETVELAFVPGLGWDGYARYLGNHRTRIEINRDTGLDLSRALHLACHEGYPGHHVQNLLIDDELVRQRGWDEFLLTPGFGPHLLVAEGAAEAATDLAFPSTAREALYRDTLLPAAGLPRGEAARLVRVEDAIAALEPMLGDVARDYLENAITREGALDRLRNGALTPDPEGLLAFAERRRTRVLAYPAGRTAVSRALGTRGLAGLTRLFAERPFALQ